MVTVVLTSKGLLETKEFDETGVPCRCRGIAGGKDVEADWLILICMIMVFKWFIYQPAILLLGTCLHLRSANKLVVKMQRYARTASSASSSDGNAAADDARAGSNSAGGAQEIELAVNLGMPNENPMRVSRPRRLNNLLSGAASQKDAKDNRQDGGQDGGQNDRHGDSSSTSDGATENPLHSSRVCSTLSAASQESVMDDGQDGGGQDGREQDSADSDFDTKSNDAAGGGKGRSNRDKADYIAHLKVRPHTRTSVVSPSLRVRVFLRVVLFSVSCVSSILTQRLPPLQSGNSQRRTSRFAQKHTKKKLFDATPVQVQPTMLPMEKNETISVDIADTKMAETKHTDKGDIEPTMRVDRGGSTMV